MDPMFRRWLPLLVLVVLPISASAQAPSPAAGLTPTEIARRQVPLHRLAMAIDGFLDSYRTLAPRKGGPIPGFASIELDVPGNTVKVFWKEGVEIPNEVSRELLRLSANPKTNVVVIRSQFDKEELKSEAKAVLSEAERIAQDTGVRIAAVGPLPGGRGLTIGWHGSATEETARTLMSFKSLRSRLERRRGLPGKQSTPDVRPFAASATQPSVLVIEKTEPIEFANWHPTPTNPHVPPDGSRWADRNPFGAGGAFQPDGAGSASWCTTGFGVGAIGGEQGLLTASHCVWGIGGVPTKDGTYFGDAVTQWDWNDYDVARITVRAGFSASYWMWDGPVTSVNSTADMGQKEVIGSGSSYVGLWTCSSGSLTGAACALVSNQVDMAINTWDEHTNQYKTTYGLTQVTSAYADTAIVGEGDSGGPVFTITPERAYAIGIISKALYDGAKCVGITRPPGMSRDRRCGRTMYFQPIQAFFDMQGFFLLTRN